MQTEAERTSTTFTACYSVCARPSYCGGAVADWDCDCWSDCLARERPAVQNAYAVALDCRNAIAACR